MQIYRHLVWIMCCLNLGNMLNIYRILLHFLNFAEDFWTIKSCKREWDSTKISHSSLLTEVSSWSSYWDCYSSHFKFCSISFASWTSPIFFSTSTSVDHSTGNLPLPWIHFWNIWRLILVVSRWCCSTMAWVTSPLVSSSSSTPSSR